MAMKQKNNLNKILCTISTLCKACNSQKLDEIACFIIKSSCKQFNSNITSFKNCE